MKKRNGSSFYPSYSIASVYDLDFQKLYEKGYRALFFDIDNTLVLHDAPAEEETKAFFERLREIGFKTAILSNNGKERVEQFASKVGAMYYREHAGKPSAKAYLDAAEALDTDRKKCLFFGDQIFTVLVRPMGREKYFHIVLKRMLEKPFLFLYKRKNALWKNEP